MPIINQANKAPNWNLADLYGGIKDPKIVKDLNRTQRSARNFKIKYMNNLANLDDEEFGKSILEYEKLSEALGKVISFAQLLFAADAENEEIAVFYQDMNERVTTISSETLFYELEINELDDQELAGKLKNPTTMRFKPWLENIRVFSSYQLSNELEQILHEKKLTGRTAWSRLFDETMAGMRFNLDGHEISNSEIMNRMSDKDPLIRKKAAKSFAAGLSENIKLFSLITNTLAKDKGIEDKWRKFPRPVSKRNLSNQLKDGVVDALVNAVTSNYQNLSHRYYNLKADWLGVDVMNYWDRNAPLPEADDLKISWKEAQTTVLKSYEEFEPKLAKLAKMFFDRSWIDAEPRSGKDGGAFSHPTVPGVHPYILMNYYGKNRDVMTLAHELGHGIHQILASPKGHFLSETPLTFAETASVFGEMLTFKRMLNSAGDQKRRRIMLASKVEDMLNTVVRQIAFYSFEEQVHAERQNGELSVESLGQIWLKVQTESLGPAFRFDSEYKYYWAYIPHFIHSPFYVYAYAFGDCLVNSLYDVFEQGHNNFQDKFLEMLKAGGTLGHKELLAPFGLDASDPEFWQRGLDVISGFIDELEKGLQGF